MSDFETEPTEDHDEPDGYSGKALVTVGEHPTLTLDVQLVGHFEPISGRYLWQGRVRRLAESLPDGVTAAPGAELEIETPEGSGIAKVSAIDLWGSHMIEGLSGRPFSAMEDTEGLL
ncbi:DUF4873 domain-containing protein [Rhodococcus sp. NPDC058514]|uniref:DUF4873 domain-containing protein n=1 Tax=unclassified Rhodococcus (in: high G+C Gram-positive bacteria) TaxID=192944 RepID=UPI00365D17AA